MKTLSTIFAVGENTNSGDPPIFAVGETLPAGQAPTVVIRHCRCFHRQLFALRETQ